MRIKDVNTDKKHVSVSDKIKITFRVEYETDYMYDYPHDYPISETEE